jgi:hypothetical protein
VQTDGISILWETVAESPSEVAYGTTEALGQSATGTSVDSGNGTRIHTCVLSGLEPGTLYHYRVSAGGSELTGNFTTSPEAFRPFSFGVWSDSQGTNHNAFPDDPLEPTKAMMAHMAGNGVDFAVACGDMAEDGNAYGDTRDYFLDRVAKYLGRTVPFFIAWGNHDKGGDAVLRKFADLPSKNRPGFSPGYGSFSFDYAGCHFVCIDYKTMRQDITDWLEGDLQAARDARFTFLFIHVPPYCELWIDGDEWLRDNLVPLMEQYGVDACFSGHTHEYERGELNGVHYFITGGGSWLDFGEPLIKDWPHITVGGHDPLPGYEHGLVNEYMTIEVTETGWKARMHAFSPSGEYKGVLDTVESNPGLSPDPRAHVLHQVPVPAVPVAGAILALVLSGIRML